MDFNSRFQIKKSLTETRVAVDTVAQLIVTPTEGTMRINEPMAELLGVDYSKVNTEDKSDSGVRIDVGVIEKDGKEAFIIYICGENHGAKLASPNRKRSGSLNCNNANSWVKLGGEKGFASSYGVAVAVAFNNEEGEIVSLEDAAELGFIAEGRWTQMAQDSNYGIAGEKVAAGVIVIFEEKVESTRNTGDDSDEEGDDVDGEFSGNDFN